jgi:hypothetical protein
MAKAKNELAQRTETSVTAYGRRLNGRARALIHDALERVIRGDMAKCVGTHGRSFPDQLAHELIESPLSSLLRINAATPSDEAEDAKAAAPQGQTNIQALYLMAVQAANKPELTEGKTVGAPLIIDAKPNETNDLW